MTEQIEKPSYSVTSLLTYEACPRQYYYTFVKKIPPPRSSAMMRGSNVHKLIAQHLTQPSLVPPDAEPRVLEWLERFKQSRFNRAPAAIEKSFLLPFKLGNVRGRIDVVIPSAGDGLEIVDFKSGRTHDRASLERHLQLPIYAIAVGELFGVSPDRLAYTYFFLESGVEVPFRSSSTEFIRTTQRVESVIESIQSELFEPRAGCGCYACRQERRRRPWRQ